MKRFAWILVVLPFMVASDCEGTDTDTMDTQDTGLPEYDGTFQIAGVTYGCNDSGTDTWTFDVTTDGLAGTITLDWYETGDCHWLESANAASGGTDLAQCGSTTAPTDPTAAWGETHPFSNNVDWDDDDSVDQDGFIYSWDRWDISLEDVAAIGDVVSGSTTLWDCGWHTETNSGTTSAPEWEGASLAYMLTMADSNGTDLDCVIWGLQSQQYWNTHKGNSCFCLEADCTD
jgi:hypothetical protein